MKKNSRINYKHLRYFAEVANLGSVTAAARALFVAPQTVSAQLNEFEQSLGTALFDRVGRRLTLTDAGAIAMDYARTIFSLGDELGAVLRGGTRPRNLTLRVGVTDSVPKTMTLAILRAAIVQHRHELELSCSEGRYTELLGRAAAGEIDMVLAEAAVPDNLTRSLQARVLGDSGLSFLGSKALARKLTGAFPACLDAAPFLIGTAPSSMLGQAIEAWFARHDVRPKITGRIEDSALLKGFAQEGLGLIAVPTSIADSVMQQFGLALIGHTDEVRQSVYLIRPRGRRVHTIVSEIEATAGNRRRS